MSAAIQNPFFAGKMAALDYFYLWELPSAELMLNQLAQAGKTPCISPISHFELSEILL
jgi:hypothetical protein